MNIFGGAHVYMYTYRVLYVHMYMLKAKCGRFYIKQIRKFYNIFYVYDNFVYTTALLYS